MAKWLIWTLLEFSTFMIVAGAFVLWLSMPLKKKLNVQSADEKGQASKPVTEESIAGAGDYKHLVEFIDQQITFAASSILSVSHASIDSSAKVNRFKLWGTVLQAERAILLNQTSEHPKPILNRFLASLLFAVLPSKAKEKKVTDLDKTLKETGAEFFLMGERLVAKEDLLQSQCMLNEDLHGNINRAEKRLKQLNIKKKEQQRLHLDIATLKNQINILKQQQSQQDDQFSTFDLQIPQAASPKKHLKHPSFKQIATLNSLSKRQTMVIDQLKNELDKAQKNQSPIEVGELKRIALAKMERMSEESSSLIMQLEAELQTSSMTIASLKEDLTAKEAKLAEIEKQLISKNQTAVSSLQTLNVNKKETLGSLRDGLNTAIEQGSNDSLLEQDKDAKMLERLLQESETCVTLLVQELEVAEQENEQLKHKAESLVSTQKRHENRIHQPLLEQREKNRQLVQVTTNLKEKILEQATNSDQQELKNQYNKKSLEFDRLQLAFTDLEMKYLGTLNK